MSRLIDADKVAEAIAWLDEYDFVIWHDVQECIDKVPTVDAERHGRWITVSDGYGNGVATAHICECSLCKDTIWVYKDGKREWHYCPNCGAKMDEVEDA